MADNSSQSDNSPSNKSPSNKSPSSKSASNKSPSSKSPSNKSPSSKLPSNNSPSKANSTKTEKPPKLFTIGLDDNESEQEQEPPAQTNLNGVLNDMTNQIKGMPEMDFVLSLFSESHELGIEMSSADIMHECELEPETGDSETGETESEAGSSNQNDVNDSTK